MATRHDASPRRPAPSAAGPAVGRGGVVSGPGAVAGPGGADRLTAVLTGLCAAAQRVADADVCAYAAPEGDEAPWVPVRAGAGSDATDADDAVEALLLAASRAAVAAGAPVAVEDGEVDAAPAGEDGWSSELAAAVAAADMGACLAVPVRAAGRYGAGALVVARRPQRPWQAPVREALEALAAAMASSLELAAAVAAGAGGAGAGGVTAVAAARDAAQARLRAERTRHSRLFESLPDGVALVDDDDRVLDVNPGFCRLFGYDREDCLGRLLDDLIVPEGERAAGLALTKAVAAGEVVSTELVRYRRDGRALKVSLVAAPFEERPGVTRAFGIYRDIGERKRAEQTLRRSEERFRSLIENAADTVAVLDAESRVLYQSPSITRMLGWRPEELVGRRTLELVHPEDRAAVSAAFGELVERPDAPRTVEYRFRHRDGSWRVLQSRGTNFLGDEAVGGIVVNSRDITESRELEAQLAHAQRMEAVGRLAGGVAHDFNNLLTSVIGLTELLLESPAVGGDVREDLLQIRSAADRGVTLTRQLLAFGRKQVLRPRVVEPNAVIRDMETLLRRLVGERVTLALSLDPELGAVRADPGQLQQVIMNLAANGRDAMPDGGRLEMRTFRSRVSGAEPAPVGAMAAGDYCVLEVRDAGTGIPLDVQEHIFEPFFTTKEVGKGSGLGLAMAYGIVKQSGGDIDVHSRPGGGTTFRVYLPRVADAAEADPAEPPGAPAEAEPPASHTVLLVEDEPGVRALARRVLQRRGFRVLEACDGAEALELVGPAALGVDLLLTDVVMPRVTGPQLHQRLAARRPGLPVVFMSGYAAEELGLEGALEPGTPFLPKPFTPEALVSMVEAALPA